MAPFPESESMTIKRLEVALRKADMSLLKDGAYKLHEKFHTGHRFEFADELKQILDYVNSHDIPQEVKEILCPTIEEILEGQSGIANNFATNTQKEEIKTESVYMMGHTFEVEQKEPPKTQFENVSSIGLYEPSVQKPIEEPEQAPKKPEEIAPPSQIQPSQTVMQAPQVQTVVQPVNQPVVQTQPIAQPIQTPIVQQEPKIEEQKEQEPYKIAIFYDDAMGDIDPVEIKTYRNKLNNLFSNTQNIDDFNLLKDITAILNLTNVRIDNFDKVAGTISRSKNHVSILTTTQSENFTKILNENEIDFEIPYTKEAKNKENACTLIPMSGLSNIFVCSNCNSRVLKSDFGSKALSIQCPNCEGACFPDLYALNSYNPDCNPIWWHRAFSALVNAKVWVLINPPLDENKEIIFDFIKTAAQSSSPERIYILSKESDKKEFYRQMLKKALGEIDIRSGYFTQDQFCEDYIKTEITEKTFV